jgi:hypothetical protein
MFTTVDEAKLSFLSVFEGRGTSCWSFIEQPICKPWFYIQLRRTDESGTYSSMLMIDNIKNLYEYIFSPNAREHILKLNYVYPIFYGSSISWKIDEVANIKQMKSKIGSIDHLITASNGNELPSMRQMIGDSMYFDKTIYDANLYAKP